MKSILLLFLTLTLLGVQSQVSDRGTYKFEFSRPSNRKLNDHGSKFSSSQNYYTGQLKPNVGFYKRPLKVPSYAVPMEPVVHYSQPDPLYVPEKQSSNVTGTSHKSDGDVAKTTRAEDESREKGYAPNQINSKSDTVSPYEDNALGANRRVAGYHYPKPWVPEPPEPIIEIIIKESNITLPPPPPLPTPPKPKRKKEPVQVFYVKYEKVPSDGYGEDKLIYDPPVPAVTPPTNNEETNSHEYEDEPAPYPDPIEDVTYAPPPSTTLKAIIKPDSETYHGSGGLHITFGGPHDEDQQDNGYSYHPGDYYQQSAPRPSVVFPGHGKSSAISRASSDAQPTKRNPSPSEPTPSPSPRPVPDSVARPTQNSFASPQEFQRPTSLPTYQQAPQFPAQSFHAKFQRPAPAFGGQPILQNHQPQGTANIPRAQPTQAYSTLPQSVQFQKVQGGHHIFAPARASHVQPAAQTPQQYHGANQQNPRQSFQSNARPTQPPQQYHTINHHTLPPANFHPVTSSTSRFSQASVAPSNPFVHRNQINQQRVFDSRPQTNFHNQVQRLSQSQQSFANFQQHQAHQPQPQPQPQPRQPQPQPQSVLNQFNHFRLGPQQPVQPKIQHQALHHHQAPQIQHTLQQQTPQQQQHRLQQPNFQSESSPEIIKSISPDITFAKNAFEIPKLLASTEKPPFLPTARPAPQHSTAKTQYPETQKPYVVEYRTTTVKPFAVEYRTTTERKPLVVEYRTTTEAKSRSKSTPPPVQYATEDPKKVEEERRKKEEKRKQNVAALPKEVPDDLREQLLSSGILGNADIQILDYDKIGDIPIENLPPEALANFQQVAGSAPKPVVVPAPAGIAEDSVPAASERDRVTVGTARNNGGDAMEMKVVRFDPDSKEGAVVAGSYVKEGATQLDPVVLNDSKYNRYLPLKVSGAQFPVPDVPELRGRNVTSVVVLAPVDYEFLQARDGYSDSISRSAGPVLEVQGVHFIAGDVLKNLVKIPTAENYRRWLDKENTTSIDKQSVVLLVLEPLDGAPAETKEIFMYDIGTQKVSKLKGELSSTFVEVAESNSQNEDLEEISDGPSAPGGDFTVKDGSGATKRAKRSQRKVRRNAVRS